jgi:hypothetical protein
MGGSVADRVHVVYITSMSHSGSTLLDMLISSHPHVVSVGEIKAITKLDRPKRCTCGAPTVFECPFWTAVDQRLRQTAGIAVDRLELLSRDEPDFEKHNRAVFDAVRNETGASVIVDSSKSLDRLLALLECSSFDLTVIHLVRSPFGVGYSLVKKGGLLGPESIRWAQRNLLVRRLLEPHRHLEVAYEQLVDHPSESMSRIMDLLGLGFEPEQLDFAGRTRHNVSGNRVRFDHAATIVHDLSWKTGLTVRQKAVVAMATAPAHLPAGYWFYKALRWLGIA